MQQKKIIKELQEIVGKDKVITDEESIALASRDYIGFRRYHRSDGKNWAPHAMCVIKPKNTDEVSKVLSFLNENHIDVVPRTGGSSVTMSIEPAEGGVIIDGCDMCDILNIDKKNHIVTAQCGTPLEYLEEQLNKQGYTTGHYPQSLPLASLGGLTATRSIGQFSTLYGGVEDCIIGLEAVLADGSVVRIKNVPRRSTGPDLRHIFIGSEGTMGFITEVSMKLYEYHPENRWMHAYGVIGMQKGLDFIREIMVSGYKPAVVRLHDEYEVQELMGAPAPEGYAMLLFIAEGPKAIADVTGEAIQSLAEKYEFLDLGTEPVEVWLKTRNDSCANIDKNTRYLKGIVSDTTEISGNWDVIGKIYEGIISRINEEIEKETALYGTMDTWLIWKLTEGKTHAVACSNASSSGCVNVQKGVWNEEFIQNLGVPLKLFPTIASEASEYGVTKVFGKEIPITGAIADQQSALFAQGCLEAGTMKCTNGTGSFMDITIGNTCKIASGGVDNLIAWKLNDTLTYMVEGFVSVTGSAVQWLRDGLKIIRSSGEIEALAASVPDTNGVYFVPALVGLTSPHNDPSARGTIIGITRGTTDAHIARATLECIAFGIKDILDVVEKECEVKIDRINVDGGASQNNLLLQMLADYCNADVARPDTLEATALGAALMAALSINQISLEDVKHILTPDAVFHPQMDATLREERYSIWKEAVDRSLKWIKYA